MDANDLRRSEKMRNEVSNGPTMYLAYVKQHATQGDAQSVIDAIDTFADKHAMINVGREKGAVVDEHIRNVKPKVMAELGAYSGYSAVRFANLQREVVGPDSHFYSFEYSPEYAKVVEEMVAFAGLSNQVTVITGAFADRVGELEGKTLDLVFIDHDKSCYVSDAELIIAKGLLTKGSLLIADNVLVPGAPEYIAFMNAHPKFKSSQKEVTFDYCGGMATVVDALHIAEFQG